MATPSDPASDFALRLILRAVEKLIEEVRALRSAIESHRSSVDAHTTAAKEATAQGFWAWARANPAYALGLGALVVLALQGQASQIIPILSTHIGVTNASP